MKHNRAVVRFSNLEGEITYVILLLFPFLLDPHILGGGGVKDPSAPPPTTALKYGASGVLMDAPLLVVCTHFTALLT